MGKLDLIKLQEENKLLLENAASQLQTNQAAIKHARIWGELNDKLEREITDLKSKLKESEHLKELADDAFVTLQKENKALSDWKESALAVFAEWDRVSDYIKPRCRLGDKYSARALELFKMIDAENKALKEEINALNGDIQSYRNGHEVNAKRYSDLLIERNKLGEEIERLEAELKNANSALDNISDMGHA